jgi:hypothetical protein
MTRQCYQDWGYVLYGEYLGMYSDNDYTQHAQLESRAVWVSAVTSNQPAMIEMTQPP